MREKGYDGFASEVEFQGYLAELELGRARIENRSPEAARQARCEKRRRRARKYWEVRLRTGGDPVSWIKGVSPEVVEAARVEMLARFPSFAKLRGFEA